MRVNALLAGAAAIALIGCGGTETGAPAVDASTVEESVEETAAAVADEVEAATVNPLDAALAAQPDEVRARYDARHPKETLEFFGVEPGMTVVETLPGGGWYTKILLPAVGPDGKIVGADYSIDMWRLFGGFADEEFLQKKETWVADWTAQADEWRGETSGSVGAFQFGSLPEDMTGAADVVLFIRSLHHFNRFEEEGGHLTSALADTMAVLKPGGIVGVVQHRGPETNSDAWAEGDNGYLKQSQVIAAFEAAGFELVDTSEINANPKDQPTEEDIVWRLPPALGTSADNDELKAEMTAIGESDRMTLKFRKPA